ncbi:hypothetical protein LINPERPRIM_LOCUS35353 [Linum perenne]
MARDVLAVPISSVASESAFSTGGRVLSNFRSSFPLVEQFLAKHISNFRFCFAKIRVSILISVSSRFSVWFGSVLTADFRSKASQSVFRSRLGYKMKSVDSARLKN